MTNSIGEVILHVGMPKTGTTSIQQSLEDYDDGCIRYARLDVCNHSAAIASVFSDTPEDYHKHVKRGLDASEVGAYRQEMLRKLEAEFRTGRQKLVISGEGICVLERHDIVRMHRYFQERADRRTVFAYIREPLSFASSRFQQQVKGGRGYPEIIAPEYQLKFEKFLDVFGTENVFFIKFDPREFRGGSVVYDFCDRSGIPGGALQDTAANESFSSEATKLLYIFNRYGVPSSGGMELAGARRKLMLCLAAHFEGQKFIVPHDELFRSINLSDVDWMESICGFKLLEGRPGTGSSELPFAEFMERTKEDTADRLKHLLDGMNIGFDPGDDIPSMLNRLFYSFLARSAIDPEDVELLKNIAIKIENGAELTPHDAEELTGLARRALI
ncbi:hypothetical protein [Hoeflea sp.]|uniref:hypothetical protein n=1 Tax=Hoeflea sp. TaxID=1940281 RepID=UPI003B01DD05